MQIILCIILLMYAVTVQCLNYKGQESRTCSLHSVYISDTPVTLNKIKVIKPTMTKQTSSKVILMQSLKDLAVTVFKKKSQRYSLFCFVFSNVEICQLSPLNICKKSNHDLLDVINNCTKFQLNQIWTLFFSVKKLFDIAVTLKYNQSLKVVRMGKGQWVLPSSKDWHLSYL